MGKYWEPLDHYSSWRKISVGMWRPADDPTIYGYETLDMSRLLPYLEEVSRVSGVKVSIAAYCAKVVANVFETYPDLNVIMVGRKLRKRKNIDVFCQVVIPRAGDVSGADLSGVKLHQADKMDLVEVAQRLRSRASRVRKGQDEEMEQTKSMVNIVPSWLMRPVLKLVDFLTYNVPFDLDWLGIRSDPFGSAMVSSVGPLDIKLGFAPLVPASRVPMVFLPGVVHKGVVVNEQNEPEVRDVMQASCTFDHRCYDGYQIGLIVRMIVHSIENPREVFGDPQQWAKTDAAPSETPEQNAPAQDQPDAVDLDAPPADSGPGGVPAQ